MPWLLFNWLPPGHGAWLLTGVLPATVGLLSADYVINKWNLQIAVQIFFTLQITYLNIILQTMYWCTHYSSNYVLMYKLFFQLQITVQVFKLHIAVHISLQTTHYCTNSNYKIGFSLKSSSTQSKFWSERSACAALGCWHKRRWPLF